MTVQPTAQSSLDAAPQPRRAPRTWRVTGIRLAAATGLTAALLGASVTSASAMPRLLGGEHSAVSPATINGHSTVSPTGGKFP